MSDEGTVVFVCTLNVTVSCACSGKPEGTAPSALVPLLPHPSPTLPPLPSPPLPLLLPFSSYLSPSPLLTVQHATTASPADTSDGVLSQLHDSLSQLKEKERAASRKVEILQGENSSLQQVRHVDV